MTFEPMDSSSGSFSFQKLLKAFFHLSLDIVLGAVFLYISFCQAAECPPLWPEAVALALALWLVYTFDHLMDARAFELQKSARHQFHKRHQRPIWGAFVLGLVGLLAYLFFLPWPLIQLGLLFFAVIAAYFLLVFRFRGPIAFLKELLVASVFAFGVATPVLHRAELPWFFPALLCIVALFNTVLFSFFEKAHDQTRPTWISKVPERVLSWLVLTGLVVMLFYSLVLGYIFLLFGISGLPFLLLSSLILLGYLFTWLFRKKVQSHERYRYLLDGAFLLYGLALLF